ncbi:sensor histidine kinase [Sphingorhabdus sp. 109]|jgi:sensor histidine kinase YesM|uniref:sensor histidine kinase n=1 Tax=Sphingorhabdus sp. 109 TaxID=2653173 RepID=UPI0012F40ACF|nr:histidine kinase [Sphingorhabdus sp. 109]VWX61383.1 Sensor histidine kinase YpdA [Sphingorhabdus sp. 109]
MAVMEIRPQPFFGNKNRAFWNLQSAGWAGALILRAIGGISNGLPLSFLVPVIISTITGYSISLLLSVVYKNLIHRRPIVTWSSTAVILTIASALYAFIDAWVFLIQNPTSETAFGTLFLGSLFLGIMLLGAWSALYYAINFFLRVEEQNDQLLQLEAQATRAQLAMLRYQLNPHFLFNTLNSISTLVLLRQTEPANAMLSRLSSFLRHTLVNEVHSRVTLAQEVETLHLYLDIEKMRFEERLRSHFDIDPAVRNALLPSLLLQPLVENAIKYAVTPQEEGADISVSAHLDGDKLRITVSDTGPGKAGNTSGKAESTGVGLGNIQERLNQAYGEGAIFETRSSPGEGFSVFIALPFETREQIQREAADHAATGEQLRNETIFGEHASSDDHQRESANARTMASFQHKDLKT